MQKKLPRIDTQKIRDAHDCRLVMASMLGKPHSGGSASRAWTWRCPFHNEQHGYSLVGWADGYSCLGQCGFAGDVIEFVMKYRSLRFVDAARYLEGEQPPVEIDGQVREIVERDFEAPPEVWSGAVQRFVDWTGLQLRQSPEAMNYLVKERCLLPNTIVAARLGFAPGDYRAWHKREGLLYQSGITIPWVVEGSFTAVNIRRRLPTDYRDENKYRQVRGSVKGLYGVDQIVADDRPLVFVEGEFDCLVLRQFVGDVANVVTLGGATGRLAPRWRGLLVAPRVIAVCDNDAAGQQLVESLSLLSPSVKAVTVPDGKDVTEFVRQLPGEVEEVAVRVRRWFAEIARA